MRRRYPRRNYDDEIVYDDGRLRFRSRLVVLDRSHVDTLIVIPIQAPPPLTTPGASSTAPGRGSVRGRNRGRARGGPVRAEAG